MGEICAARSQRFRDPGAGLRAARRSASTPGSCSSSSGAPQITTGVLHAHAGAGQIGAGVAHQPIEPFRAALEALAERLGGGR